MISKKHLSSGTAAGVVEYMTNERTESGSAEQKVGYYSAGQAPVEWVGSGAKDLGLAGPVAKEKLVELLEGKVAGQDISTRGNRQSGRRMGTDFTVSAPKSVSILALAGGDQQTLLDHDFAVRDAVAFIEREMAGARTGKAGINREGTGWVVGAAARHEDARPVAGVVGMDLHSHCVLANITRRKDGKFSAIDYDFGGKGSTLLKTADAIYKSSLERRLHARGIQTYKTEDGFEVSGITREQIEAASFRKTQIDADLAAKGLTREDSTPGQRDASNKSTRESKKQLDRDSQRWAWRAWSRENGIDPDRILAASRDPIAPTQDAASLAVTSAAAHLSEREAVFSYDDLRLESLRHAVGGATEASISAAIATGAGGVVGLGGGKYTTEETLRREADSINLAKNGIGTVEQWKNEKDATIFIETLEHRQGFKYSDGQRAALLSTITSKDATTVVIGGAGVGKSQSLKGATTAAHGAGFEVVGLAPSAAASDLLKEIGANSTGTLESYLLKPSPGTKPRMIVLDEAGMVSTKDLLRLQEVSTKRGDRLLLVGDYDQLQSVGAGGGLHALTQAGIKTTDIREVQRQRDAGLKDMAQAWADGRVEDALTGAKKYMREVKKEGLAQAAAEKYLAGSKDTLVLCPTNKLRQDINEKIRAGLIARGEIGRQAEVFGTLTAKSLTKEQMRQAKFYAAGDIVRVREGKGVKDYRVVGSDGKSLTLADRDDPTKARSLRPDLQPPQSLYRVRDLSLAPGDKIIFTENRGRGADRVLNNMRGEYIGDGRVRRDDGSEVALDKGHSIDRGWCTTIHKAQGATADRAILVDGGGAGSAHLAYVGLTRAKDELEILTPDAEKTQKNWGSWAHKQNALKTPVREAQAAREKAREALPTKRCRRPLISASFWHKDALLCLLVE